MTPRRFATGGLAIVLVALVIGLLRLHVSSNPPGNSAPRPSDGPSSDRVPAAAPDRRSLAGQPALTTPKKSELSTSQRPPLADRLGAPGTPAAEEPRIVLDVLDAYRRSFGGYPTGEGNRQFVNALLGANRLKLSFIPSDHPRLNSRGELVDAWGTPFFFHLLSHSSVEVRSAGPDRMLYTADDILAGTPQPKPVRGLIPAGPP